MTPPPVVLFAQTHSLDLLECAAARAFGHSTHNLSARTSTASYLVAIGLLRFPQEVKPQIRASARPQAVTNNGRHGPWPNPPPAPFGLKLRRPTTQTDVDLRAPTDQFRIPSRGVPPLRPQLRIPRRGSSSNGQSISTSRFPRRLRVRRRLDRGSRSLSGVWARGDWEEPEHERMLTTVLFTDIVGSTAKAAALGDRAWAGLVVEHHRRVRARSPVPWPRDRHCRRRVLRQLRRSGPRDPMRMLDQRRHARDRRPIRAGIHTGECEIADRKIAGIAVNVGARIASFAEENGVLVCEPSTTSSSAQHHLRRPAPTNYGASPADDDSSPPQLRRIETRKPDQTPLARRRDCFRLSRRTSLSRAQRICRFRPVHQRRHDLTHPDLPAVLSVLPVSRVGGRRSLPPDFLRYVDDEAQLRPLLFLGESVALLRRGESALGREAQLVERRVARRFVDPPLQLVFRLEHATLCRDETQHDLLVAFRQKPSGSKPPERSSSHSMKYPSTSSSLSSASATKS